MSNKPSHYIVDVFENEFPKYPSEFDIMSQILLPDGRLVHTRITEDISSYIRADETLITDYIAYSISCNLLNAIQKDLQSKIAEMIWERFKGYDLKST